MTLHITLTLRYTLFAILATVINLGTQVLMIKLYQQAYAIELSILLGTGTGLLSKYFLDKHYIFDFKSKDFLHDTQLFIGYSVMGLSTTALFWGIEYGFHHLFGTDTMRYLGGVIGLMIGYMIKYQLDKTYVFVPKKPLAAETL